MPDNPISGKAGNITRLGQMLSFFNELSADVDFVSLEDWGEWNVLHQKKFKELYPNIHFFLLNKKYKKNFFKYFFLYKIPYLFKKNSVDITSYILRKEFSAITHQKQYDKIIISYASWGYLAKNINYKTHLILDTHDFITAQKKQKKNHIGRFFQDEMEILSLFDEIWTYSVEEEYIFGQFTDKKITLIPISFPSLSQTPKSDYLYEVIFVGSNNPHNVLGMNWFLQEVTPHLNNIKVHVIGKICQEIPDAPNITKHGIVDSLDEIYQNAKIAICPMLSGTGIKIKVLEALSYSLPVITNRRGVDGLINKNSNGCIVCNTPKEFAESIFNMLNNNDLYSIKKQEAQKYFQQNHTQEKEKQVLNTIFNES